MSHSTQSDNSTREREIKDVAIVDLRYAKNPEDLADIRSISDAGVILVPQNLVSILGKIDIHDVGGIMPVPTDGKVSCMTGQVRLSGEALEAGDPETILVIAGQAFITSAPRSVGFKEIWICGQLFAPRGSERAISPKIGQITGQNFFLSEEPRFVMGEDRIDAEFLELLPKRISLVVMGLVTFTSDVSKELLMAKVEEVVLMGEMVGPLHLLSALRVLTKEKMGEIKAADE